MSNLGGLQNVHKTIPRKTKGTAYRRGMNAIDNSIANTKAGQVARVECARVFHKCLLNNRKQQPCIKTILVLTMSQVFLQIHELVKQKQWVVDD